ncbi:MAG: Crp/Fnr family transcriptional regulator [Opitutales bacterium]
MRQRKEYPAGATIIKQGATDRCFYVLEKGAVEVVKDGVTLNVLIYPGTIFGEIGSILGKPRTSSVKARNATTVICFESVELDVLVRENPEIAVKMLETLASRLDRTTQKLSDSL